MKYLNQRGKYVEISWTREGCMLRLLNKKGMSVNVFDSKFSKCLACLVFLL